MASSHASSLFTLGKGRKLANVSSHLRSNSNIILSKSPDGYIIVDRNANLYLPRRKSVINVMNASSVLEIEHCYKTQYLKLDCHLSHFTYTARP